MGEPSLKKYCFFYLITEAWCPVFTRVGGWYWKRSLQNISIPWTVLRQRWTRVSIFEHILFYIQHQGLFVKSVNSISWGRHENNHQRHSTKAFRHHSNPLYTQQLHVHRTLILAKTLNRYISTWCVSNQKEFLSMIYLIQQI